MTLYQKTVQLIHQMVANIGLDDFFTHYVRQISWFRKWIPGHICYPKGTLKHVQRDGVWFTLDVSDYMQWYIYSNLPEAAWHIATESIKNQEKTIILDIGSNVGEFSWKCAHYLFSNKLKGNIIAFDPNPAVMQQFIANGSLNPTLQDYVIFENKAVGDAPAWVDFHYSDVNTGVGKIGGDGQHAVKTEIITIDQYIAEKKIDNVDFIKIDVEGFEPKVIKGAQHTIRTFCPILYIEITEEWHGKYDTSSKEIFDFLTELGYTFYLEQAGILSPLSDPFSLACSSRQINVLAKMKIL